MDIKRKHVFISYCRENFDEVKRLRQDLINEGEAVWWDQDVTVGQSWEFAISEAMKRAYAVVVCLSRESEARDASGIYPELSDAIKVYRKLKPGGIYIFPVRLSECQVPSIKISETLALDELQYTDLFPESRRDEGLRKLLDALKAATLRP